MTEQRARPDIHTAIFNTIDAWDCTDDSMSELADRIIAEHIEPLREALARAEAKLQSIYTAYETGLESTIIAAILEARDG